MLWTTNRCPKSTRTTSNQTGITTTNNLTEVTEKSTSFEARWISWIATTFWATNPCRVCHNSKPHSSQPPLVNCQLSSLKLRETTIYMAISQVQFSINHRHMGTSLSIQSSRTRSSNNSLSISIAAVWIATPSNRKLICKPSQQWSRLHPLLQGSKAICCNQANRYSWICWPWIKAEITIIGTRTKKQRQSLKMKEARVRWGMCQVPDAHLKLSMSFT